MKRRLYFLLPDTGHARAVANDLKVFSIKTDAMHVLAKPGVDLSGLPVGGEFLFMQRPGSEKAHCSATSMNSCRVLRVAAGEHR